jgi:GntR family transcriptional regulator
MEVVLNAGLPLYQQVKNHLESLIINGQLQPGDQLPSESELEDQFSVSRVTVRRALQELAYDGKIQRVVGKGSFVLKPKIEPLTALTSFSENMKAQGYNPSYQHAVINIITPSPKIKETLSLQEGEKVVYLTREMLADGLTMALQYAYFSERIYARNPGLFSPEVLNNISFYKILEIELGISLKRAEESVDAALARRDEARKLNINPGEVVLIIERTTFDTDDLPIEYVKLVFPVERYRYKVELFRPTKADKA